MLDSYSIVPFLAGRCSPVIWKLNCSTKGVRERKTLMNNPLRKWHVTLVDVLVGLAVLMILSALVVPVFLPPEGRAASKTAAPTATVKSAKR